MGFTLASVFGARRKVVEFGDNESKTPFYIISTPGNMWLADKSLNEVHHFKQPRAQVVRLDEGHRTFSGIDKGRWFVIITDEAQDQDGWMGYKKLYCNSRARAEGIYEDAERIRKQYEAAHPSERPAANVWEKIERSERAGERAGSFMESFDSKVREANA